MVRIVFYNDTGKELQDFVVRDLKKSIQKELQGLECQICKSESQIIVTLKKNRLNGMNLKVKACCENFDQKIREALLISHPH